MSHLRPGWLKDEREESALEEAREHGYLRLFGREACRKRLSRAWLLDRWRAELPFLEIDPPGAVRAELHGPWSITRRLANALSALVGADEYLDIDGDHLLVTNVSSKSLDTRAGQILSVILATAEDPDEPRQVERLTEGEYICSFASGFEEELTEGESYFLREIPEMEGHVAVFPPGRPPLVGIHLARFQG